MSTEAEKREAEQEDFNDDRAPLHPLRVYKELGEVLDRDARKRRLGQMLKL